MSWVARAGSPSRLPTCCASHSARSVSAASSGKRASGAVARTLLAGGTYRHCDLVLGPTRVRVVVGRRSTVEIDATQHREQLVVGDVRAALGLQLAPRLAPGGLGRGANVFERQRPPGEIGLARIARTRSGPVPGDGALDLVDVLAPARRDPVVLGVARGDARQLAYRGVRHAALELGGQRWQLFEGECDTDAILGGAWAVAEATLEIVEQVRTADLLPDPAPRRRTQPARFFGIERAALPRQRTESAIDLAPARTLVTLPLVRDRVLCLARVRRPHHDTPC